MPRERQFSADEVLDAAADAFAAGGYQGTSLAALLQATGLAKQSLYNSFGDKRSLYLQALDCAAARFAGVQAQMASAASGRQALHLFFEQLVGLCASDQPAQRNCIVSAGLLEGHDDPLVRQQLLAKWQATRELLRAEVERGQKDGSVANRLPSAELADLLMNLMAGLRVAANADTARARMARTADLTLALLDTSG